MVHRGWLGARSAITATATWCALFAALHLYWALGGRKGLASSAGHDLAERRPAGFVVFGLYGVALLLIAGIVLLVVAGGWGGSRKWSRRATAVVGLLSVVLLLRGIVLEILVGFDVGGLSATIGPSQTYWSLVLWNPWFILGGVLFLWVTLRVAQTARLGDR